MCEAVALASSELPTSLHQSGRLENRVHSRGGEPEVRFYWRARPTLLPVWLNGTLQVVRWGNRCRTEKKLPPTGWTWQATVESGRWSALEPEPVTIPASFALAGGVWFKVTVGVKGLVVRNRGGALVVYVVCEPATRYFRVMTRSEFMPVLVGELI